MKEKSTPPKATEEQLNQQQDSGKITAITFLKSHRSIEQIFGADLREVIQDSADELPERTEAEWDKFLRELAIVYPRMRAAKEREISFDEYVGHLNDITSATYFMCASPLFKAMEEYADEMKPHTLEEWEMICGEMGLVFHELMARKPRFE